MIFYHGFALKCEEPFFSSWLNTDAYTVAGFSYGAIKAFEHALTSRKRVDTLQLFSPAFFQTKKERFLAMQLEAYSQNPKGYLRQFLDNCFYPAPNDGRALLDDASIEALQELLYYTWEPQKLSALTQKGIAIEVYLGEKDRIIDSAKALEFFTPHATVFYLKACGHFLLN